MAPQTKAAHLVRIDSDSTHGWQARVGVTGRRNGLSMLCSDSVYGGAGLAERAAKAALRLLQLRAVMLERQRLARELRQRPLVARGA